MASHGTAAASTTARLGASSTAKAFVVQVYTALHSSARPTPTIDGVDCARLWVQGVVVAATAEGRQCTLDDGTGVLQIELKSFLKNAPAGVDARPHIGDYIMVIGPLQKLRGDVSSTPPLRTVLAHQVVNLNAKVQREAMWFLEVLEYWHSVVASPAI